MLPYILKIAFPVDVDVDQVLVKLQTLTETEIGNLKQQISEFRKTPVNLPPSRKEMDKELEKERKEMEEEKKNIDKEMKEMEKEKKEMEKERKELLKKVKVLESTLSNWETRQFTNVKLISGLEKERDALQLKLKEVKVNNVFKNRLN